MGRPAARWHPGGLYGVTVAFLAELLVAAFGLEGQTAVLMIVGSLLMGVTAYFGYKGMEALSAVSVPLMAILCFWVVLRALGEVGGVSGLSQIEGSEPIAFGAALTIIVGTFASGGTQVPNWSRFARTGRHALYAAVIAFFIGEIFMLGFGAIGALAFSEGDFVQVLLNLGLVFWAVILLLLNLWTTNDNTAYAFGVAGAELFNVPSKKPFVIGGVILGTIIALSGIYEFLPGFLVLLGVFIPPLGGAIIGDYLFVWRGELPAFDAIRLPVIRYSCVAAYVLATLVAYVTAEAGIGVPPLHGVLIAGLAVPLFERALRAAGVDQLAQSIDTQAAR